MLVHFRGKFLHGHGKDALFVQAKQNLIVRKINIFSTLQIAMSDPIQSQLSSSADVKPKITIVVVFQDRSELNKRCHVSLALTNAYAPKGIKFQLRRSASIRKVLDAAAVRNILISIA